MLGSLTCLPNPAWLFLGNVVSHMDDETGNLKSGGDWVMETTGEDVHAVYFGEAMVRYSGLLHSAVSVNNERNDYAFAALRSDGSVVCCGPDSHGGE